MGRMYNGYLVRWEFSIWTTQSKFKVKEIKLKLKYSDQTLTADSLNEENTIWWIIPQLLLVGLRVEASGRKPEVVKQVRKARLGGSCVVLFYSDSPYPGLSLSPLDGTHILTMHTQEGAEN